MSTKPLNIYFYKLESKLEDVTEYNIGQRQLSNAFLLNNQTQHKSVEQKGGVVGLWERKVIDGLVVGTFYFVLLEDLPKKTNYITKETDDIEYLKEDGLLYCSPFLFNPNNNILLFGNRNPGANLSTIRNFISNNYDTPKFETLPVVKGDAYEEFFKYSSYSKIVFRVSNPNKYVNLVNPDDNAVSDLFDLAEESNATEILIELKNSKTKELDKSIIQNIVKFIKKEEIGDDLKKLIVVGDNESESQTIDLLTNRLIDTIDIEIGKVQNYEFQTIYDQLIDSYEKFKFILDKEYEEIT